MFEPTSSSPTGRTTTPLSKTSGAMILRISGPRQGHSWHGIPMQTFTDEAEKLIKAQRRYLIFLARRLARWAGMPDDKPEWGKQVQKIADPRAGPPTRPHLWRIHQGTWRCALCQVKVVSPHTVVARRPCPRIPSIWEPLAADQNGHELVEHGMASFSLVACMTNCFSIGMMSS